MCLYPKFILNKKYIPNKKNRGHVPPISDLRLLYVPVGCSKCIECAKQKSRMWQVRLSEEIKTDNTGHFVTLTFNPESLSKLTTEVLNTGIYDKLEENEVATLAIRRFLERWRKHYKKSVKHWLITELGHSGTERIHIHGIIWTTHPEDIIYYWCYGFADVGKYVNQRTVNYIVKYVTKQDNDHKGYVPKIHTSSGIGKGYFKRIDVRLNKYNDDKTDERYTTPNGKKINLPIYYRNKIYSEEEREKLWLNKLDKNIRYVCGEKINIADNDIEYYKTLDYYRRKNKRLGYGDDTEEWSIQNYKRIRKRIRELNKINKINKINNSHKNK